MAQMTDAEVEVGVALNWAEQGGPLVVSDIAARGNTAYGGEVVWKSVWVALLPLAVLRLYSDSPLHVSLQRGTRPHYEMSVHITAFLHRNDSAI